MWPGKGSSKDETPIRSTIGWTATKQRELRVYKLSQVEGERPLFPPKYKTEAATHQALLHLIRRTPAQFGYGRSRWSLGMIAQPGGWLKVRTASGLP